MGLPVAAPAAATAFGAPAASAAVYSSLAASAALPTVASMTAGPLASVGSSMFMNQAFLSPATAARVVAGGGGGGLLSNISLKTLQPYLFAGSTGLSMMQTLKQAEYQKAMYQVQDLQLQANLEMKKLNFELDSIDKLKRLKTINAANLAKAYGGGVVGLDGSTKLFEEISGREYSKDYAIGLLQFRNDMVAGNVQSDIYKTAQVEVMSGAALDSAAKLGNAAYLYSLVGGPPPENIG